MRPISSLLVGVALFVFESTSASAVVRALSLAEMIGFITALELVLLVLAK